MTAERLTRWGGFVRDPDEPGSRVRRRLTHEVTEPRNRDAVRSLLPAAGKHSRRKAIRPLSSRGPPTTARGQVDRVARPDRSEVGIVGKSGFRPGPSRGPKWRR